MISNKYKFIYLRNPKTASTSIIDALGFNNVGLGIGVDYFRRHEEGLRLLGEPYSELRPIDVKGIWGAKEDQNHCPMWTIQSAIPKEIFDEYFKFGFVRNPWDKLVSSYHYWLRWNNRFGKSYNAVHPSSFGAYIERLFQTKLCPKKITNSGMKFSTKISMSQSDFLGEEGLCDFIGRYERLDLDFDYVCDTVGYPRVRLCHKNCTNHEPYKQYYTKVTKLKVAEMFAEDIERFQYTF